MQPSLRVEELACLLDTEAMPVLVQLIELFCFLEKVPPELKRSILVPFLKNPDKDIHDPSNFRSSHLSNRNARKCELALNRS